MCANQNSPNSLDATTWLWQFPPEQPCKKRRHLWSANKLCYLSSNYDTSVSYSNFYCINHCDDNNTFAVLLFVLLLFCCFVSILFNPLQPYLNFKVNCTWPHFDVEITFCTAMILPCLMNMIHMIYLRFHFFIEINQKFTDLNCTLL